ncbi:angiotensin-converting enzyme-like [Argopecten irradians]|uniref:angiotensin-converting enzyme-like n=1 Tax=Argopecten irradians TaxID=31199 RepID=UPI0037220EDE
MTCMYISLLMFIGYCAASLIDSETEGRQFIAHFNAKAALELNNKVTAKWNYVTNISNNNRRTASEAAKRYLDFRNNITEEAAKYNWKAFTDESLRRQFKMLRQFNPSDSAAVKRELVLTVAQMLRVYHSADVCPESGQECLRYKPSSDGHSPIDRNASNLLTLWKGWRQVTGQLMRPMFVEYVDYLNRFSKLNGYKDGVEFWNRKYESSTFENDMYTLIQELQPLYKQLHCYVRRKLIAKYGNNDFQDNGQIPAHLVGYLWGGNWDNMYDLVKPYPEVNRQNVTKTLQQMGYTVPNLVEMAQDFYKSLGFESMTPDFWSKSLFTKPKDREMECQPIAFDFSNKEDFRIKMCANVTEEDVITIHSQMGHTVYQMSYKDQPFLFRGGANPAFTDAAAGLAKLSILTQDHLKIIGLISEISNNNQSDINALMRLALETVAPLPFYYIVDKWRWDVLKGRTANANYNIDWWKLRCQQQGISPPEKRTEQDLDIAASYRVAGNQPYIHKFVSTILKFQWHKALCSNDQQPLHKCDIYRNTLTGSKLKAMLELGASRPWPEAMNLLTGTKTLSAKPLLEYFQPLMDWLGSENDGHGVGWDPECPKYEVSTTEKPPSAASQISQSLSFFNIFIFTIILTYVIS